MKEWIEISELRKILDQILTLRNIDGIYKNFINNDLIEAELGGEKTHGLGKTLLLDNAIERKKEAIINDVLEAELSGKNKVGVAKILLLDYELKNRESNIELVKECGNYALFNGHKELGHIAALTCVDKVIELAKTHGNAIVGLTNASRYGRLKPFARKIAENNLIGIVMNNAGPAAVTAYGGITPILGTNPICFGFPSNNDEPYLFDFSTSKKIWGEIRQAKLENRNLPSECFLDEDGNFTLDPDKANAVIPFGDAKGFALCYAIEILAGAFTGSKMGLQVNDEYDLGFLFMAFSPEMFGNLEEFKNKLKTLESEIKSSIKNSSTEKIYIPGELSKEKYEKNMKIGKIQVDSEILNRLRKMAISFDGGIENSNKMN